MDPRKRAGDLSQGGSCGSHHHHELSSPFSAGRQQDSQTFSRTQSAGLHFASLEPSSSVETLCCQPRFAEGRRVFLIFNVNPPDSRGLLHHPVAATTLTHLVAHPHFPQVLDFCLPCLLDEIGAPTRFFFFFHDMARLRPRLLCRGSCLRLPSCAPDSWCSSHLVQQCIPSTSSLSPVPSETPYPSRRIPPPSSVFLLNLLLFAHR